MKKSPDNLSPNTTHNNPLEQKALAQFIAGRYKEASDLYKELLKSTGNEQWRQQLAQCYLLRARALAGKGMLKEAVILWENYAEQVSVPQESFDHYLAWLLVTKNAAKIKTALARLSVADLDENYPELAAVLGLQMITEHPEFVALLPQDSVFMTHLGIVREALTAYRENQPDKLDEVLKKLPFRSAFRDFRTLLKAAVLLPSSAEQARALLIKIPFESPYHPTAQALLTYMSNGEAFVSLILQHSTVQRKIIVQAKGFTKKHLELLETLHKQNNHLTDKLKFNLVSQYQSLFGAELSQRFCYAALANYPAGRKDYGRYFGNLTAFDENRLKALRAEQNNNSYEAETYWHQCLSYLKDYEPESSEKIAFIQRHIAKKAYLENAVELLIDSLNYDPEDRETYLQILKYYDQDEPNPSEYKQWLEKSLKQFPQDVEFLTFAIKAATRGKAFKKASQYAQILLKIDPVNTLAKQFLFDSHLAHARRLIKGKKFHLVDKEILQAEKLNIHKKVQAQAELMRGFFHCLSEDKQQGLAAITEALLKLNADPVSAHFQATMEALLFDFPVATVLKGLPPIKERLLSGQELTHLMQLIKHYNEQDIDQKTLHKALDKIKPVIKKSLQKQDYNQDLLLMLCQALDLVQYFDLLSFCAKLANNKWFKPIWLYYWVYSEAKGDPKKLNQMDIARLQFNISVARDENDQRTTLLISRFIERYYDHHQPFRSGSFLGNSFDQNDVDDIEDMMGDLFGHLPESVFDKINAQLEIILSKGSPEQLLFDLMELFPQKMNQVKLAMLFQDPEFFIAVAMLKAANDLGIQTGLSAQDIIDYFDDGEPNLPFPFF